MDNKTKITFTQKALPFILDAIGFKINKKGLIIDKKTNELAHGKKSMAKDVIAISKNEIYTSEVKLIGDLFNDKYGIFL